MKKVLLLFMIGLSVNALASERIGTQFLRSSDELMTDVIVQPPGSKKKRSTFGHRSCGGRPKRDFHS